jgi:hypothetical protein
MNERINFWISQPYCPVCDVWPFWPGLDPEAESLVPVGPGVIPYFGPEYGRAEARAPGVPLPRTIRGTARFELGALQMRGQGRVINAVRGRMQLVVAIPSVRGRAGTSMEDREEELILQLIMTE